MFDIGFSEIFVIAIVALLVLGPERLPKAARFAGLWVRRARAQWYSVKSELENELAAEDLKRSLKQTQDSLREAQHELNAGIDEARNRIKREQADLQRELDALDRDVRGAAATGADLEAQPGLDAGADAEAHDAAPGTVIEERPLASASDPALQPPDMDADLDRKPDTMSAPSTDLPVETDSERPSSEPVPAEQARGRQKGFEWAHPEPVQRDPARLTPPPADDGATRR